MTYIIKQEKRGNKYLSLECDTENIWGKVYITTLSDNHNTETYFAQRVNRTTNRQNALATYRRYRKYMK